MPRKHCQPRQRSSQETVRKGSGLGDGERGASSITAGPRVPLQGQWLGPGPLRAALPTHVSQAFSLPKSINRKSEKQARQMFTTKHLEFLICKKLSRLCRRI